MIHFIDSSSMMLALTLCAGDSSCLSVCPSEESCPGVMLLLYEDKLTCNKWTFKKTSGPKEFQSCCFFLTVLFLNIIAHQDKFHTWLPLQRLFMLRLTFICNSTGVRAAQKGWHLVSCPLLPWEIPSPRTSENVQSLKVSAQTWAKENPPVKLTSLICSCLRWLQSYINQAFKV